MPKSLFLTKTGICSRQKCARPSSTLAFFRMPKAQQAAQFKFAASSKANQLLLRAAVVKTGGFTKIFIAPPTTITGKSSIVIGKPKRANLNISKSTFTPPKTALAPKTKISAVQTQLTSLVAQPGSGGLNFPLLIALALGAFLLLKN